MGILESSTRTVAETFAGRRLLITGGTGFIGKALIEKLLWSVPEVDKLLLLIRPQGVESAGGRLTREILASPAMARLRTRHGFDWERWAASKVEAVEGDLGSERLGLGAAQWEALAQRVDGIVSAAATVRFDERLDRALELNTRGALRVSELARAAGDAPLVQVSTCFVSGTRRGPIAERAVAWSDTAAGSAAAILDELEGECRRLRSAAAGDAAWIEAGRQTARRHGFHDVYTLTKALAEGLLADRGGHQTLAIVRPAIVESALAEPCPGWIEAVRVADPLLVAYGRGHLDTLPGAAETPLDIVPVDRVVNTLIASLARLAEERQSPSPSRELPVYQVTSSRDSVTLGKLLEYARDGFAATPMDGAPGKPRRARLTPPRRARRRLARRSALLGRLAGWLGATPLAGRLAIARRRADHFLRLLDVFGPYLEHGAVYEDVATRELERRLAAADRVRFPLTLAAPDWRRYIERIHIPGLVRFALDAESGAPPPPPPSDPLRELHAVGHYPPARQETLFELFAAAAATDPDSVALQTARDRRWRRYTYGQALAATANIARRLRETFGVERGDRVVLWSASSPEWVLTAFAVQRLGAVTVPLDPQWSAEEALAAARFVGARLVCAEPRLAAGLETSDLPVAELDSPLVPEPWVPTLPGAEGIGAAVEPDDVATIHFTSGTTVAPKAVPLTHANLLANVRDLVPIMRSSRERLLSVLPLHHVFELTVGLLVPLAGGGTISYVSKLEPAEISWMMGVTRPTMLVAVPRLLELLHNGIESSIAAGGRPLAALFALLRAASSLSGGRWGQRLFAKVHRRFGGSLERIATGGSALDPVLGKSFQLMGFRIAEGYGMTETSPVLTVNPWDEIRFGSVGRPLPGVEVGLGREPGEPPGSGQIWVRGANVMSGYYRDPEASAEVLRDGWLATGDIGRFDADGYLHICGRIKEVIVTAAGKNVYPEEVEARYRDLPGVDELVAIGLPGRGGGEQVAAVVVPRDGDGAGEGALAAIRDAIDQRSRDIPSYQRITRVELWRGELPKTSTMKVRRGALRAAILEGGAAARSSAEPAATPVPAPSDEPFDAAERELLATLGRLTRLEPASLRAGDRLADLGVDSLTRVELLGELETRFGLRVADEDAAELARVGDLLGLLQSAPTAAAGGASLQAAGGESG